MIKDTLSQKADASDHRVYLCPPCRASVRTIPTVSKCGKELGRSSTEVVFLKPYRTTMITFPNHPVCILWQFSQTMRLFFQDGTFRELSKPIQVTLSYEKPFMKFHLPTSLTLSHFHWQLWSSLRLCVRGQSLSHTKYHSHVYLATVLKSHLACW